MREWIAAALMLAGMAAAQRNFDQVQIKTEKVSGNIYMLTGAGGNIGVSAGDDGLVIVDSQFAPLAPKIEAALKGIVDKPVRFLLNTHWHGDHTGGNAQLGKSGTVVAHENVRKRLVTGSTERKVAPAAPEALPVITFTHELSVHLNGEEVRAIHFPRGHTDGDSVIFFTKSNVVHMGDDFFVGRFPFVDMSSGGTVPGLIAGIEKVLAETPDDIKIIPGHGPLSTKTELRTYLEMIRTTSAAMQEQVKKKRTLEQVKADPKSVLGKYAGTEWGSGFIKDDTWIETLYRSHSQNAPGAPPKNDHGHSPKR